MAVIAVHPYCTVDKNGKLVRNPRATIKHSTPVKILWLVVSVLLYGIAMTMVLRSTDCSLLYFGCQVNKSTTVNIPKTWKDSSLLNITNFRWIRNNASICNTNVASNSKDVAENLLLIMVNSAREHYNERSAIRKAVQKMTTTVKTNGKWNIRLVFLLGIPYKPEDSSEKHLLYMEEAFLSEEHSINGDLIVGNFVDSFENITYKTMMGFKWALNFCTNATFIVKMDDNAFFNIPKFVEWRNKETRDSLNESGSKAPSLYCIPDKDKKPLHGLNKDSFGQQKWLVSTSEWQEKTFPEYCQGLLYGMTVDLAQKMYSVSNSIRYFRLEDIFFTGVVMDKVTEKYGLVNRRYIKVGPESAHTLGTVCEKKMLRQTVSDEVELVVKLERDVSMEKRMFCLAKNV